MSEAPSSSGGGKDRHKGRMVRVRTRLANVLKELESEREVTFAHLVNEAVREYLEKISRWPPKSKVP